MSIINLPTHHMSPFVVLFIELSYILLRLLLQLLARIVCASPTVVDKRVESLQVHHVAHLRPYHCYDVSNLSMARSGQWLNRWPLARPCQASEFAFPSSPGRPERSGPPR